MDLCATQWGLQTVIVVPNKGYSLYDQPTVFGKNNKVFGFSVHAKFLNCIFYLGLPTIKIIKQVIFEGKKFNNLFKFQPNCQPITNFLIIYLFSKFPKTDQKNLQYFLIINKYTSVSMLRMCNYTRNREV